MALSREERNARVRSARAAKAQAFAAAGLPRSLAYGKAPKGGQTVRALGFDTRTRAGRQALAARVPQAVPSRSIGTRSPRATVFNPQMAGATGITHLFNSSDRRFLTAQIRAAARRGENVAIRATFDTPDGPKTMTVGAQGQHKSLDAQGRPLGKVQVFTGPNPGGKSGSVPAATVAQALDDGWDLFDWIADQWDDGWDEY